MPATVRLNKEEEKSIREKCIEINKILIKKERPPMRESELVHAVLKMSIQHTKVNEKGELYIDV